MNVLSITAACLIAGAAGVLAPSMGRGMIVCQVAGTEPLPRGKAGDAARAFVAMYQDNGDESIRFFEENFRTAAARRQVGLEERIKRVRQARQQHGALEVTEILESSPEMLVCLARDSKQRLVVMGFEMSQEEPGRVDGVQFAAGDDSIRPQMLTPPQIDEVVEKACAALEAEYVFPDVAAKMAALAKEKLKAGEYYGTKLESALARKLQADFRSVSRDKHLRVNVAPPPPGGAGQAQAQGPMQMGPAASNYGFKKVEVLPGNVGYVKLDGFAVGQGAEEAATAAMQFVSNCDAVVFDLRQNGGGSPEQIRFITSYLYAEPTHLNDMVDRNGNVVEEFWTLKEVPGKRLKADIPVYVLTSGYTFSGAEEFSYNLKNLKRATVIGETTGGGAHPVKGVRITDRFMVGVPHMRAQNPISKDNWEGRGVSPDIEVPADKALDTALEHARAKLAAGPRR